MKTDAIGRPGEITRLAGGWQKNCRSKEGYEFDRLFGEDHSDHCVEEKWKVCNMPDFFP